MQKIIEETFTEMVSEIETINSVDSELNRYHETASISEVNLVYHFVKQLEKRTDQCAVYLEFPCDSGRVDALVLYENNIFLIEAKTNMDNKKYKVLNAQAMRFENKKIDKTAKFDVEVWIEKYYMDSSLRDTLKDRVVGFMSSKWKISGEVNIYGILLADALLEYQKDKWGNNEHYSSNNLNCMKQYRHQEVIKNKNFDVWYLGCYRKVGIL